MTHTISLSLIAVLAATGGAMAQQPSPLHTLSGIAAGDAFGTSVSSAGDVNGDGLADVIVGSPKADDNGADSGRARVFSGSDGSVLHTFLGDAAGDEFGASVSGAGDVNGDGLADLIVGAPKDDDNGSDSGTARVFSGTDGSVLYTFVGDGGGVEFGTAVSSAGDVNADGYADVIVGAPLDNGGGANTGSARVLSGVDGSVLYAFRGDGANDQFGTSVSAAGDYDGDCFGDVIVGAPFDDNLGADGGSARVLSGADGSSLLLIDGSAGDNLGWSVGGLGDLDGDGAGDVVVGAPLNDAVGADAGAAYVYLSSSAVPSLTLVGDSPGDQLGWSVSGAGDVDGDGIPDVVTGAPRYSGVASDAGIARVWSGSDGRPLLSFAGDDASDQCGASVSGAGDVDGDGYADILAGAPNDDEQALDAGSAFVIGREPFATLVSDRTVTSLFGGGDFGSAVATVGDVNNDGVDDYAVGATLDAGQLGTATVYSSVDHSMLHVFFGSAPAIFYATRVASAGDIDQDGYGDIIVGAVHDTTLVSQGGAAFVYSGRDGTTLLNFFGSQLRSHMGTAVGSLGDVDGDTVDDLFIGQGTINGEAGEVLVVSGSTGLEIYRHAGQAQTWLGWSASPLGDLDGDGICDFVVGAPDAIGGGPGLAKVLSGVDGSVIYLFRGAGNGGLFGFSCNNAGDVDGDGMNDIIVGGYTATPLKLIAAGYARVYSGATGAMLYDLAGDEAGANFGRSVAPAGDANGDGYDDFLVGAPGTNPGGLMGAGSMFLYSGWDGSLLKRFDGTEASAQFGKSVTGIPDSNGDGYSEQIAGVPVAAGGGAIEIFATEVRTDPGRFWTYGAACEGSNGSLPGIGAGSRPVLGAPFQALLTTAVPNATSFLLVDVAPQSLPLDVIGAPGCTLLALPLLALAANTDATGKATFAIPIAANPAWLGANLYLQWLILDPPASMLGLVASNGGALTVGQ